MSNEVSPTTDFEFPEGRIGLVLTRRAEESIHIFYDDTETILEVVSLSNYPKSITLRLVSSQLDWRLSSAPREPVSKLSMTETDAVHLVCGEVSIRIACLQIDRNQTKIGLRSQPMVTIYRHELLPAIEQERRARGIVA
jgi:sRNA-binding carbon storage regulator CsrA